MTRYHVAPCIVLVLVAGGIGFAQTDTGVIGGAVTDQTRAAVPRAEVTARNSNTGTIFRAISNESGNYVIPALPPGRYEVSTTAKGFARTVVSDVVVNVQSRLELNLMLKLGDVAESVQVTAESAALDSQTSSLGQVIENKLVATLPLNGRNYSQLAVLTAGATPNWGGSRAADGFNINGNRTFQNVYLIDGIDNNNYILGVDTNTAQAIRPSVDAIQEFKVETADYSAEFGHAAGGVISVSIKPGTNAFHGSAFEFLRNDKLDANNFFSNRVGAKRPPLRQNQFGGTAGGPVIRNRTFFFASYQGTRYRIPSTVITTVPTGAAVRGNFGSTAIFDPLNVVAGRRQPFATNTIPDNRLDPVARRLAALYPQPNLPGAVNNYAGTVANNDNQDQTDLRVDHRVTAADNMFVRYSRFVQTAGSSSLFGLPGNGNTPFRQTPRAYSVVLNETHIFTPSLVNEFRAGYTFNSSDMLVLAPASLYEEFGIKGVPPYSGLTGLPNFNITGFAPLGDRAFTPNPKVAQVRQFIDNATWVKGNHTLKFGAEIRFTENFAGGAQTARGQFYFNGQFTSAVPGQGAGSGLADLLLGQTNNANLATVFRVDLRNRYYGYFLNDNWKLNRKLTLNLGLRWELQSPYWEHHDRMTNFDLDPRSTTYGTFVNATGTGIRSRTFSDRDLNNFAPRVGLAWELNSGTVIRAAAGIFYGGYGYAAPGAMPTLNPPYTISLGFPTASTAAVSNVVLGAGFAPGVLDPKNVVNPAAVAVPGRNPLPEVYQWNIGIQRRLPGANVLSIAYVGSGSSYLPGFIDVNDPPPGPGAINARRPFPAIGAITLVSPFAHSTYHSLQTKVERRFTNGLSLLSSYTWGHSIDNSKNGEDSGPGGGPEKPQNPRDTNAERSSSNIDIRHRWVTSIIYEPRLDRLASARLTRALAGGWQFGGIFVASTGPGLVPGVSTNPANTTGPLRPNRLRDGNLPRDQRNVDGWFDPAAFAIPAAFTYGNSGRYVLRAPGLVNLDAVFARNFQVTERARVEFRAELFNLTNSVHFGSPSITIGLPQAGRITSTRSPNRQVQLGLRVVF
ncbi:MAG: TonB-dependent receptor [Bryobacterales bacterium]|nr:TonB-dependent receptor [Bryobacterales bacterium]